MITIRKCTNITSLNKTLKNKFIVIYVKVSCRIYWNFYFSRRYNLNVVNQKVKWVSDFGVGLALACCCIVGWWNIWWSNFNPAVSVMFFLNKQLSIVDLVGYNCRPDIRRCGCTIIYKFGL